MKKNYLLLLLCIGLYSISYSQGKLHKRPTATTHTTKNFIEGCSPDNGTTLHSSTGPTIDEVDIPGTILANSSPGAPTNGYNLFADSSMVPNLAQGVNYTLNTTFSAAAIASVWFDWNNDGQFDASEWTQITINAASGTISFMVDPAAVLGQTTMRVRSRLPGNPNASTDACTTFGSGETEDYVINIIPGTACTGTPVGGTAIATALSVCSGTDVNFTDTGATSGTTGLSYQWQMSADSGKTFSDIAGADSISNYMAGYSIAGCYRRSITCGTSTVYSTVVCVGLNPTILCPCSPNTGTTLHYFTDPTIDEVDIPGTKLTNSSPGAPANGYTLFNDTTIIPNLVQGVTYTLNTTFDITAVASVWFDWNQDGVFDPSEWTQITTNAANGSISFTVDPSAVLGNTIMRIRSSDSFDSNGSGDACTSFYSGETEDYVINIVAGTACTGKPIGGVAIASALGVCSGTDVNFTDTGATTGVIGLSYQWQESLDSGKTFNDIAGADSVSNYMAGFSTAACYRRSITCGTNTVYSTVVCVSINPASLCACSPLNGTILHNSTGPTIDEVDIPGTNLANSSPGAPTNGYNMFNDPSMIPNLNQGSTYTLNTTFSGAAIASVWFDWNQDGSFDPSEWTQITKNAASGTTSFTVPTTALQGNTLMRVRSRATGNPNAAPDACTTFGSGETEDYVINVIAPLPVSLIQFKGQKDGNSNILTWTTTKESDNKGFEILRSFNGVDFNTIGFVASSALNGNSSGNLNYRFMDNQAPDGNNYYRLKQVDINGKTTYSNIVLIRGNTPNKIEIVTIYPNPAHDRLSMVVSAPTAQYLNIQITDISGRILQQDKKMVIAGDNQLGLIVSGLAPGTYFIKASCNNGCEAAVQKFLKQ